MGAAPLQLFTYIYKKEIESLPPSVKVKEKELLRCSQKNIENESIIPCKHKESSKR